MRLILYKRIKISASFIRLSKNIISDKDLEIRETFKKFDHWTLKYNFLYIDISYYCLKSSTTK